MAGALKCQRAIAKETSKFVKAKMKALQKCHDSLIKDTLGPDPGPGGGSRLAFCTAESKTSVKIGKAQSKIGANIAKACGGKDKICDRGVGEEATEALGFYATCPDLEGMGCSMPISDCGDIAACIECIADAAVDQGLTLFYDAMLDVDPVTQNAVNKCQQAIGKETTKFLLAKEKALAKCHDGRFKGTHANPCPVPGDGKAGPAILKAEQKNIEKLCKACGGADKRCDDTVTGPGGTRIVGSGGSDDLTPAAIGFPSTCNAVTVPGGGPACLGDGSVDTLAELVECVDCVSEFKVDCIDAARAPEFEAYPCECNALGATSPTPTPTAADTPTPGETPTPTLMVSIDANPQLGPFPLTVDLIATVTGTAQGPIDYFFWCDNNDSGTDPGVQPPPDRQFNGSIENPKTALSACSYPQVGEYVVKVIVRRGGAPNANAGRLIRVHTPDLTWVPRASLPSTAGTTSDGHAIGANTLCAFFSFLTPYCYEPPPIDAWYQGPRAPTSTYFVSGGGTAVGTRMYFITGRAGGGNHPVLIYNVLSRTWDPPGPPVPEPRAYPAVVAAQGKIFVIGGERDSDSQVSGRIDVYDPGTSTWEPPSRASMVPRWGAAATVIGDVIYVMGGSDGGGPRGEVWAYDTVSDLWTERRSMPRTHEANSAVAGVMNGRILVVGVGASTGAPLADEYDPVSNWWSGMLTPVKTPPTAAHWNGAGGVINGKFYVAGGNDVDSTEEGSQP